MLDANEPVVPPLGSLFLPQIIDFHWKYNPAQTVFAFNHDGSQEVTEISYVEFGRASHRAAHALRPGRTGKDKKVVAFIALADTLVYQTIVMGLVMAGLVPFGISPRITPAAIVHLLKETSCHRLVATQVTLRALLDGVKSELKTTNPEHELIIDEVPSLDELYPRLGKETLQDPFQPYPCVDPSPNDIALYLHSSGSTGPPKAVPQSHKIVSQLGAGPSVISLIEQRPRIRTAAMHLPPFHMLGFYVQLIDTVYSVTSIGVYPPVVKSREMLPVAPTPDNILDHTRRTKSNGMSTIPALLNVWAQSKESIELLSSLEFVGWSGGTVAPKLGNLLVASGVKLASNYGGTEFGMPTLFVPKEEDRADWEYVTFTDKCKVRWVSQGDGTYECQFLTTEQHRPAVENLPDVKGYATSDLWEKHPTKDHLWKIVGRIDDVIMHSSGEKTVPAPMEDIVMSSRYVMGTTMFGRGHDLPGILVEPKAEYAIDVDDQGQLAEFRNKIWSVIEEANTIAPAFSRIFKEMILITSKDKPLPRTGKGTVMKKLALKEYHEEIEAIYTTVESAAEGEKIVPPETWSTPDVQCWLLNQAADIHAGKIFSQDGDLFEQGFDSLSATIIRRRITGALQSSKKAAVEKVTQNVVYNHPTIDSLATFIAALVADPGIDTGSISGTVLIEEMIERYSSGLDKAIAHVGTRSMSSRPVVVLLTGSTGNLGSQILASLLKDDAVERVYALNRPSARATSMVDRHRERFQDKALDIDLLKSRKLVFIEGDISQEYLGLSRDSYDELCASVTVIIHNAWKLDFNLALTSFEQNIRGTRNLIDFARSSPNSASLRFLFTSSVSSAQSWDKANGPYPEEVVTDASVAVGNGYGESKYVSERILAKSGLQMTSFRIGQISGGSPNGAWATSDWFPILVKSSVILGALPGATGVVSWLPMGSVSQAILDVALSPQQPPSVLNLTHPRPVEWNTIVNHISVTLHDKRQSETVVPIVPFHDWFALLEMRARSASDADMSKIPAIKLLDFFRSIANADLAAGGSSRESDESGGLPSFATKKAQDVSATMRDLVPLDAGDAERWVKYWIEAGLFNS